MVCSIVVDIVELNIVSNKKIFKALIH